MSHPDGLPDLFLDRSPGRIQVPRLPRDAGLRLITLAEHYGIPEDEGVTDVEWLELAGRNGWAVLLKDARIRGRTAERQTVQRFEVRCFCVTRQNLTAAQMAQRYLDQLDAITNACPSPAVHLRGPRTTHRASRPGLLTMGNFRHARTTTELSTRTNFGPS